MSILRPPQPNELESVDLSNSFKTVNPWIFTPIIGTLCETYVTVVDIRAYIEAGLKIIRFKMQMTKSERINLRSMIKTAVSWCCEKYNMTSWPLALSIDIVNICIKTGSLIEGEQVYIEEDSIVTLTSDESFTKLCSKTLIFMDDPYALEAIKLGTEITISFGEIVMICITLVDDKNVQCKVFSGGTLSNYNFVCIRGIIHLKPPLAKRDLEALAFAKDFKADIVIVNSVRYQRTLKKIKGFFSPDEMPLIVSTICEQQGLDNIDAIIEESDGIILAREFLAHELLNKYELPAIQLYVGGKCQKQGKPFYLSGTLLQSSFKKGQLASYDLTDITNAVLQRTGFVLRSYKDQTLLLKALTTLHKICRAVEPYNTSETFWRMSMEFKVPVNTADAAILGSALLTKQTGSFVIILPTVTGWTARQLSRVAPEAVIVTISSSARVARQLQLYAGIVAIIYDKKTKKDWFEEMEARIELGVSFSIKNSILKYGDTYVCLKKALPTSSFCDHISIFKVTFEGRVTRYERLSCDL